MVELESDTARLGVAVVLVDSPLDPVVTDFAVLDEDTVGQVAPITVLVSNCILGNSAGGEVWVADASDALVTYSNIAGSYPGTAAAPTAATTCCATSL